MMKTVIDQIWNISDGTLSTLTNLTRLYHLDRVRSIWSKFIAESDSHCSNWVDAWKIFLQKNNVPFKEDITGLKIDGPITQYIQVI